MKVIISLLFIAALIVSACLVDEIPETVTSATGLPTSTTAPPTLTITPTLLPTATNTPKPTIDLTVVLTPQTTVSYEIDYLVLKTSDGVQIMAKLYGKGEPVVILAHQGTFGANQRDWDRFARMLAERGFSAATLDFRGYGLSKGDLTQKNYLIRDMSALIDYLKEAGYSRFICMGASMGGTTCMRAAIDFYLDGMVVIGSLWSNGKPTNVTDDELAALTIPKLFITTDNDRNPEVPVSILDMYKISQEPKELRVYPGEAHGTEMFRLSYGEEFTAELMAFVESLR